MVLDGEGAFAGDLDPAIAAVKQRHMALCHAGGQAGPIHRKAVVHGGNLHHTVADTLHRMVGAAMPLVHLHRPRARRQRQHLMPQTNAKHRHPGLQQAPDHRHRISPCGRRIARPVRQEHASGLQRHDRLQRGLRRNHRHPRPCLHQIAEDIILRAVIDRHHMRTICARRESLAQRPNPALPSLIGGAGHGAGQIQPLQPAPALRLRQQRRQIKLAIGRMGDHRIGRAGLPDPPRQRPRIQSRNADLALRRQPFAKSPRSAEVRGRRHILPHHTAHRAVHMRLEVLVIDADIADMRESERHDLPGIGRIGHHLLIPGHRGIETNLAHSIADSAKAAPPGNMAIGQHQNGGCALGLLGVLPTGGLHVARVRCGGVCHEGRSVG